MIQTILKQSSVLNQKTADYVSRVNTAGGKVDLKAINAIDRFFSTVDNLGITSKIKLMTPGFGDYEAAKVPVVAPVGMVMDFTNWSSNNYNEKNGFFIQGNVGSWVRTGLVPSAQGIAGNNITQVLYTTTDIINRADANGFIVGMDSAGNNPGIWANSSEISEFGGASEYFAGNGFLRGQCASAAFNDTGGHSVVNGVPIEIRTTAPAEQYMDSEITFFKATRALGGPYFSDGGIGCYIVAEYLTVDETVVLQKAVIDLMETVREPLRRVITGMDSITAGQGTEGNFAERWGRVLAAKLGKVETNVARGGAAFGFNSGGGLQGTITYYPYISDIAPTDIFLCIATNDFSADVTATGDESLVFQLTEAMDTVLKSYLVNGHNVVVGGPPFLGAAPFERKAFWNDAIAAKCDELGVYYVDLGSILEDDGRDLINSVNFHPNSIAHRLIAEAFYNRHEGNLVRTPTAFGTFAAPTTFSTITTGSSETQTLVVRTAKPGMKVVVSPPNSVQSVAGVNVVSWVSAPDQVSIRIENNSGADLTVINTEKWRVTVEYKTVALPDEGQGINTGVFDDVDYFADLSSTNFNGATFVDTGVVGPGTASSFTYAVNINFDDGTPRNTQHIIGNQSRVVLTSIGGNASIKGNATGQSLTQFPGFADGPIQNVKIGMSYNSATGTTLLIVNGQVSTGVFNTGKTHVGEVRIGASTGGGNFLTGQVNNAAVWGSVAKTELELLEILNNI